MGAIYVRMLSTVMWEPSYALMWMRV